MRKIVQQGKPGATPESSYTSKGQAAHHSRPLLIFRTTSPVLKCFRLSGETGSLFCCPAPSAPYFFNKAIRGRTLENSGRTLATAKPAGGRPQSHLFLSLVCASLWAAQCSAIEWNDKRICTVSASWKVGRPLRHSSFLNIYLILCMHMYCLHMRA